ncbi:MAG TPA: DciA family protein [Patescibacteria group bacterium]|nr:DciA family protein [Patescibacteria group bacterium]
MSFDKIENILNKKKKGQSPIESAWVCYCAQQVIDEIIKNDEISAASFKNNTLVLQTSHPILAGEIRFKSAELIKKINHKLKKDLIRHIRTKIYKQ